MRKSLLIISFLLSLLTASAQELNCTVEFNTSQLQNVSNSVFTTLQAAVQDYMNNTKFSEAQIATSERIECRMFFTITEYTDGVAKGTLQVQSSRPIYNTSYTTTLLNTRDGKIDFTYQEGEPLQFSETDMESQLTAILNYYAYLILALDFDSFSPRGGEPFWTKLKTIVQQAQSSGETGWKAFEDNRNRSAILEAYTAGATDGLRDLTYQYHRRGLDEMAQSPDRGRSRITESMEVLKEIYDKQPMSVGLVLFKDAKLDELVNIYSQAPATEREKVYELLYPLYPTETQRLDQIKKGKTK